MRLNPNWLILLLLGLSNTNGPTYSGLFLILILFFVPLEHLISEKLLSTLFGCEVSPSERTVFSLPAQMGGLNILNPTTTGASNYSTSRRLTTIVIEALKENTRFDIGAYHAFYSATQGDIRKEKDTLFEGVFSDIVGQLSVPQQWAIIRAKDEISLWLTVFPLAKHHFDLSATEFRDALALQYKKLLLGVLSHCDGCGDPFDLSHALSCRKGGLVTQRHNEVCDAFGDLAALAWSQVTCEPIVREACTSSKTRVLVGSWFVDSTS